MWQNLDEMSAALSGVVAEAIQADLTKAQAGAVVSAAVSGGPAAVEELAATMSTEDLMRVQARLEG
ncbi:hypothetical protein OHA98_41135 [Streptomyces sp. NBC_00654]|uniref:hypothetical protein n=1 Tax=Streptomyces sp. NBC_00654 TaxID=2975799 RepID=UPI002255E8E2|nr:hypothetical protein [Streptomyces sp. NBC_00654]MCX4971021.1 hypothetical protein [Streptomyces sp. NBC_00654]